MKLNNKYINLVISFLEYFLVIILILECCSNYTEMVSAEIPTTLCYRYIVIAIAGILLLYHLNQNKSLVRKNILQMFVPVAIVLYALFFWKYNVQPQHDEWRNADFLANFVIVLPMFICLLWLMKKEGNLYGLLYKYSNVMSVYAMLSVIVYFVLMINSDVLPVVTTESVWTSLGSVVRISNFFNVCGIKQSDLGKILQYTVYRNIGAFPEPLMFCIPLISALYIELFLKKHIRWTRVIVLSVAVLTTQASLGLLLLLLAWGLKVLEISKGKYRKYIIVVTVIGVMAIGCFIVKNKLNYSGSHPLSSFSAHIEDYVLALKCFRDNPIFGTGYQSVAGIWNYMSEERFATNRGLSNSIAVVLAQGGIVLGILCMSPFLIGLLNIFNKKNYRIALWMVGVFGLYVLTIFHYHYYMIFLFALGYALIDIGISKKGEKMMLKVSFFQENDYQYDDEKNDKGETVQEIIIKCTLMGIFVLVLSRIPSFWNMLHTFFATHRLYLFESVWTFPLAVGGVVAVFLEVTANNHANRFSSVMVAVITGLTYMLLLPVFYSWVHTIYMINGNWNDPREAFTLFGIFLSIFIFLLLLRQMILDRMNGDFHFRIAAFLGIMLCTVIIGVGYNCSKINNEVNKFKETEDYYEVGKALSLIDKGVYVEEEPFVLKNLFDNIKLSVSSKEAYLVYENASILMNYEDNVPVLFENGFKVTRISDNYILYSNDKDVIESMESAGYDFYAYYAYPVSADLGYLSEINNLELNDEGAMLLEGTEKSMYFGPYTNSESGDYEIEYNLHFTEYNLDDILCTVRVSADWGANVITYQEIYRSMLDENGDCVIVLPYKTGDFTGMEYCVFVSDNVALEVRSIRVTSKPSYITINQYNWTQRIVRQDFYNIRGERYMLAEGYAVVKNMYNNSGSLIQREFYDTNENPVITSNGYASVRKEYNGHNKIILEEYFGVNGEKIAIGNGYTRIEWEYGEDGKLISTKYYDLEGRVIN